MAGLSKKANTSHKERRAKHKLERSLGLKFILNYMKTFKKQTLTIVFITVIGALINGALVVGLFFLTQTISGWVTAQRADFTGELLLYALFFILAYLVYTVVIIFRNIFNARLSAKIGHQMRTDTFLKLKLLKLAYYDTNASGDIMSRVSNDTTNVTNFLSDNVTNIMSDFTQMIIMLILMFIFAPAPTAILLFVYIPISFAVIMVVVGKSQKAFKKRQKSLGILNGFLEETISSMRTIRSNSGQEFIYEQFKDLSAKQTLNDKRATRIGFVIMSWNVFTSDLLNLVVVVIPIIFASSNWQFGGAISTLNATGTTNFANAFSVITVFSLFSRNFTGPVFQIFNNINALQSALAGAGRVNEIIMQPEEVNPEETIEVQDVKGDVKIHNLDFYYNPEKQILKNINLDIKAGQVVGIVGPTGSGKTTIINLLTKFYDIEHGTITIDGNPIQKITKQSLRDQVSIVLQDTFLFNESILDNILADNPNATEADAIRAAKLANAHDTIMRLRSGYQTIIGDQDTNLSVGERQLIDIARAILKNTSILILDEATSNVDTETEAKIQKALIELQKNKTTFIIAHRLSTIKHADIIVVLKDGAILEKGNHQELIAQGGFYKKMYYSNQRDMDAFE